MAENLENKTKTNYSSLKTELDEFTVSDAIIGGLLSFVGGAVIYGGFTYLRLNEKVENPMPAVYVVGGLAGIICGLFGATDQFGKVD